MKDLINKNNLIRYKILEVLYLKNQEGKRISFNELLQSLQFSEIEINQNLKFLEGELLVEDKRMSDGHPIAIKITSKGIILVEEINISNKSKGKIIGDWVKINASWIIPSMAEIMKLLI